MREFEEGNFLEVGEDLLELLLVVEEGVVEWNSRWHSIHLCPQLAQVFIGNVRPPSRHLCDRWRTHNTRGRGCSTVEPPNKGQFGGNGLSLVERSSLSRR